jgi:hypothetical protein
MANVADRPLIKRVLMVPIKDTDTIMFAFYDDDAPEPIVFRMQEKIAIDLAQAIVTEIDDSRLVLVKTGALAESDLWRRTMNADER